jgi:hypothetical protein
MLKQNASMRLIDLKHKLVAKPLNCDILADALQLLVGPLEVLCLDEFALDVC